MRKVLVIFCSGISFLGCSQKEKTLVAKDMKLTYNINDYIYPEAKDITESNYANKLNSQIKHYKEHPIYYIRTHKQNCLIEVYVNDVRNFRDYEISNYITPTSISSLFLKSGSQRITVKMYPVGNLNNESWGKDNQAPITELSENSSVEISVVRIDEKSNKGFDDETLITKQVSPKEATGKEYYEFSFTFDAKVPYEFEGWTKGQDLTKLDQKLVRKKALEFYSLVGQIHLNKELDCWLKLNYPSDIRIKGSYFKDKQNLIDTLAEYVDDVRGDDYQMEPIKDFKVEFMGNRKLLRLVANSLNSDLRGGGALILKFGEDGIYQPGISLYLPEGRDLATQGFMMWK